MKAPTSTRVQCPGCGQPLTVTVGQRLADNPGGTGHVGMDLILDVDRAIRQHVRQGCRRPPIELAPAPRTCSEAGDRCRGLCTQINGTIIDPDCFRHG